MILLEQALNFQPNSGPTSFAQKSGAGGDEKLWAAEGVRKRRPKSINNSGYFSIL
jgi:hypothetical protein